MKKRLIDLPNIGRKRAEVLRNLGLDSVSKVSKTDAEKLVAIFGHQISKTDAERIILAAKQYGHSRIKFAAIVTFAAVAVGILANVLGIYSTIERIFVNKFKNKAHFVLMNQDCVRIGDCPISASFPAEKSVIDEVHFFSATPYGARVVPICLSLRFGVKFDHRAFGQRKLLVSITMPHDGQISDQYNASGYPFVEGDFETCSIHEPFYFPDHPEYQVSRNFHRNIDASFAEFTFDEYPEGKFISFHLPIRLDPNSFIKASHEGTNPYLEEDSADLDLKAFGEKTDLIAKPISVSFSFDDLRNPPIAKLSLFNHVISSSDEIDLRGAIISSTNNNGELSIDHSFVGQISAIAIDDDYIQSFKDGGLSEINSFAERSYFVFDEKSAKRALSQSDTNHLYGGSITLKPLELSPFQETCINGLNASAEVSEGRWRFPTESFNTAHNAFRIYGIMQRQMPNIGGNMEKTSCFDP